MRCGCGECRACGSGIVSSAADMIESTSSISIKFDGIAVPVCFPYVKAPSECCWMYHNYRVCTCTDPAMLRVRDRLHY